MSTSFQAGATTPTNGTRIEPSEKPTDGGGATSVEDRLAAGRARGSARAGSAGRSRVGARLVTRLVGSLVGLAAITHPVAAQSANRELIDGLAARLLVLALPLTALVLGVLAYGALRRRNEAPTPAVERPLREVAWTVGTAVVLIVAGVAAYPVLTTPYLSPEPADGVGADDATTEIGADADSSTTEIEVVAAQWEWRFRYDEANVTTRGELVLPADEDVRLVATSRDVIHAFAIPALGVKRTVYPGEETVMVTAVDEQGTYRAHCTEFCGTGHATMRANVTVVDRETYDAWLAAHEGTDDVTEPPDPAG